MSLGSRIKERREQLGLSRNQLASKTGVTPSAIANYENEVSSPKTEILHRLFDALDCDANYLHQDDMKRTVYERSATPEEFEQLIRPYRALDGQGQETVLFILNQEFKRAARLAQLESPAARPRFSSNIIELHPKSSPRLFTIPYFRGGVSAGTGIFILGNEAEDEIELPDLPQYQGADFAIDVNGQSMEPDFSDGDIALVSQNKDMHPGDVGVFVVNGATYIKELGDNELISRNKAFPNLPIREGDHAVCMGRVIGKVQA